MGHDSASQAADPLLTDIAAAIEAGLAGTGVTPGMRAVLEVVYRNGPMSAAEMGDRLRLTPAFVHRMADLAEAAGLLEPMPDPAHRNAPFMQITRKGRMTVWRIRDGEAQHLRAIARMAPHGGSDAGARIRKALDLFFAGESVEPKDKRGVG